jgi:DNA-binding transcriptional regulator YiaG
MKPLLIDGKPASVVLKAGWKPYIQDFIDGKCSIDTISQRMFPGSDRQALYSLLKKHVGKEFIDWFTSSEIQALRIRIGKAARAEGVRSMTDEERAAFIHKGVVTKKALYGDNLSEITGKIKATMLERYGVDNASKLSEVKAKKAATVMAHFGVSHQSRAKEVRDKTAATNLERYGTVNPSSNPDVKAKRKQTYLDRYGVKHPMLAAEVIEKVTNYNIERYGVPNQLQAEEVKAKIKQTNLKRYGFASRLSDPEVHKRDWEVRRRKRLVKWAAKLDPSVNLNDWRKVLGDDFINFKISFTAAMNRLCWYEYKSSPNKSIWKDDKAFQEHFKDPRYQSMLLENYSSSKIEIELRESFGMVKHLIHSELLGRPIEIDCFLPERKIGFELNGYHYHTSSGVSEVITGVPENYHRAKTEAALSAGILLFHIWYVSSDRDRERIFCLVKTKLGIFDVHCEARKLKLTHPGMNDARVFYSKYHVSGAPSNSILFSVGLEDAEGLVACMSFVRAMGEREVAENVRLAYRSGVRVTGGFDRLMKHAAHELRARGFKKLVTFCDRDLTPDYRTSVYARYGFRFVHDAGPSLFYWNAVEQVVESRWNYRRKAVKYLFPDSYSDDRTVDSILIVNRIFPCYNSGNFKFELDL